MRLLLPLARLVALLAAASSACTVVAGDAEPSTGRVRSAIQGGKVETALPSVGMLEFSTGNFGTATLITPRVVLTAGHVVGGDIQGFFTGPGRPILRGPDTSVSAEMKKYAIARKLTHPSYQCTTDCAKYGAVSLDIGLVLLDAPSSEYTPVALGGGALAAGVGCTTVGYGNHVVDWDASDAQPYVKQKRGAGVTLVSFDADDVAVSWGTGISDHGDSGGPLFCNGALVGTTAYHDDGDGPEHQVEHYVRVDAALPWIHEQLLAWGDTTLEPTASTLDASTPDPGADAGPDPTGGADSPYGAASSTTRGGCAANGDAPGRSAPMFAPGFALLLTTALLRRRRAPTSCPQRQHPKGRPPPAPAGVAAPMPSSDVWER